MADEKKKPTPGDKFERATLIAQAGEFKTTPELMAGALYDVEEPLTREEAQKRLEAFLTKEVKR